MTINFLNIAQVLVAVALIIFILIQRGPGATAGSAFGGGASGTVFGAKGSGSFLTKATAVLATLFFIITMLIAIDASESFSTSDEASEQDLGVFGTIDNTSETPVSVSTEAVETNVSDVIDAVDNAGVDAQESVSEAVDSAVENAENAVEEVKQAAEDVIEEVTEESSEDSDDNDGGNN